MDDETTMRVEMVNLLLGKMARDEGLITQQQLKEVLAEQARDLAGGRKQPRPLGVILVAKGYLSDQQLVLLLQKQRDRGLDPETQRRAGVPPVTSAPREAVASPAPAQVVRSASAPTKARSSRAWVYAAAGIALIAIGVLVYLAIRALGRN